VTRLSKLIDGPQRLGFAGLDVCTPQAMDVSEKTARPRSRQAAARFGYGRDAGWRLKLPVLDPFDLRARAAAYGALPAQTAGCVARRGATNRGRWAADLTLGVLRNVTGNAGVFRRQLDTERLEDQDVCAVHWNPFGATPQYSSGERIYLVDGPDLARQLAQRDPGYVEQLRRPVYCRIPHRRRPFRETSSWRRVRRVCGVLDGERRPFPESTR
jgi:hypothetical protein